MTFLRWIRRGAWTAIILVSVSAAVIYFNFWRPSYSPPAGSIISAEISTASVGAPFSLVTHRGTSVSDKDFRGRPMAVFFGFTHCPKVCPTTLVRLANLMRQIGSKVQQLQILLITVDPERDTPEQLALYLQSFEAPVVGLTGSAQQIEIVLNGYKAYATKVETKSAYTMDHSAAVYLMDAQGRFESIIAYEEEDGTALEKLRRLLK